MSTAHTTSHVFLSDRTHTWADDSGSVFSVLDLGDVEITFDSAEQARQVAARCLEIADAIDAKTAEVERGRAPVTGPLPPDLSGDLDAIPANRIGATYPEAADA